MNQDATTNHQTKHTSLHLPMSTSVTWRLRKKQKREKNNNIAMSENEDGIVYEEAKEYVGLDEEEISGLLG
jgi:hypothetical protein